MGHVVKVQTVAQIAAPTSSNSSSTVAGSWSHAVQVHTVAPAQVCLFVQGQNLQKDLNRIARTTGISSDQNCWAYMLKETSNSLLRHEEEWISGYSYIYYREHGEVTEKCFEKLSQKERIKSGVETLVNLEDMEMRSTDSQVPNEFKSTYMVVTIFVSASRMLFIPDMPTINGCGDIEEALRVLQLVSDKRLHGVNVFFGNHCCRLAGGDACLRV